ncbi:MAG: hypothetical protein IPL33_13575 [Sphingobacteriales bacterium]|jgi:hypothetical protein|nr:hypothetical protein [Sphingobacteriales bacterium]
MCCRKATKCLIERPKKDQTAYYSGKNGKNLTQKAAAQAHRTIGVSSSNSWDFAPMGL